MPFESDEQRRAFFGKFGSSAKKGRRMSNKEIRGTLRQAMSDWDSAQIRSTVRQAMSDWNAATDEQRRDSLASASKAAAKAAKRLTARGELRRARNK